MRLQFLDLPPTQQMKAEKNIQKISDNILQICKDDNIIYKENKNKDLCIKLFRELYLVKIEDEEDLDILISLHRALCEIKNSKAIYFENNLAKSILLDLPLKMCTDDTGLSEDELEILEDDDESPQGLALKLSIALLNHSKEILASKDDKSARYKNRVRLALELLCELQNFYILEEMKEVFQAKIQDKDKDIQYLALHGLKVYYGDDEDAFISKKEVKELKKIISTTTERTTASTCYQILINTFEIDELEAVVGMDRWKDKNRR